MGCSPARAVQCVTNSSMHKPFTVADTPAGGTGLATTAKD
jgi:hypothetical protein